MAGVHRMRTAAVLHQRADHQCVYRFPALYYGIQLLQQYTVVHPDHGTQHLLLLNRSFHAWHSDDPDHVGGAGGLLFSSFPGFLADRAGGSYIPAYRVFLAFSVLIVLCVQGVYLVHTGGIALRRFPHLPRGHAPRHHA